MTKEEIYASVNLNQIQIQIGYQLVEYFQPTIMELIGDSLILTRDTKEITKIIINELTG